jgi:hypothetical protein
LKHARHRASRLFLKDGARSSLPQYRQTNLSALDGIRDDRRATFFVFEAEVPRALTAMRTFFVGADPSSIDGGLGGPVLLPLLLTKTPAARFVSMFTLILLLGWGLVALRRPHHSLLCRGGKGSLEN